MHTLTGTTTTLLPLLATHSREMYSLLRDPSIYRYLDEAPPASQAVLERRFQSWERRKSPDGQEIWLNWIVRAEGSAAGYVQSTVYQDGHADIAYVFGPTWWGRNIAFEACVLMLRELYEHYRVHLARAVTRTENDRSVRLLKRLGFAPAGDEGAADDVGDQESAWTLDLSCAPQESLIQRS